MKITALIPARSGSKRVKDKNIRPLGGIPLMAHSIITAIESGFPCYVSSNSPKYIDIAKEYQAIGILRPPELATDKSTDADVVRHAVKQMGDPNLIVYLRPTTPFRTVTLVKEAIEQFIRAGAQADSLRSVEQTKESIDKLFLLQPGFLKPVNPLLNVDEASLPDQQYRPAYTGNGYVDIVKPSFFLSGDRLWGRCMPFVTQPTIDIDTEQEFEFAQYFLSSRKGEEIY